MTAGTIETVPIKLVGNRLAMRPIAPEKVTEAGLILPDTIHHDQTMGVVIAIGLGLFDYNGNRVPLDVEVGDVIVIQTHGSAVDLKYAGTTHKILFNYDVLAIVGKAKDNG